MTPGDACFKSTYFQSLWEMSSPPLSSASLLTLICGRKGVLTIMLEVNEEPLLPYVCLMWQKLGWTIIGRKSPSTFSKDTYVKFLLNPPCPQNLQPQQALLKQRHSLMHIPGSLLLIQMAIIASKPKHTALLVPLLRWTGLSFANMNVCVAGNQDRNRAGLLHDILLRNVILSPK